MSTPDSMPQAIVLDSRGDPIQDDLISRRAERIRLARLESDIAYFQTRLQLIGELNSSHRVAQHKVFRLLLKATARELFAARRNHADGLGQDVQPPFDAMS